VSIEALRKKFDPNWKGKKARVGKQRGGFRKGKLSSGDVLSPEKEGKLAMDRRSEKNWKKGRA